MAARLYGCCAAGMAQHSAFQSKEPEDSGRPDGAAPPPHRRTAGADMELGNELYQ